MRAIPAGDKLDLVCKYMHEKTGVDFDPFKCNGFAIVADDNRFIGAVIVSNLVMHGGKPVNCEISCASETSMAWRHHVCQAVFQYIFGQLGCVRCTSTTRKNNTKAREFLEALNFQLEGNIRKGYDGKNDALIYGLLAEECRFFGGLNG